MMEDNKLMIEITATLEQIQKANQMIAFHQNFNEPDLNAVRNFTELRADFLEQLKKLMEELQLEVRLSDAA